MNEALRALRTALPLAILSASWRDPELVIRGDAWSFAVLSPWRLSSSGVFLAGSWTDALDVTAIHLEGHSIVDAHLQSAFLHADFCLVIDDGRIIETFSADAHEPWVLKVPGYVFVASPADLRWMEALR